MHHNRLPTGVAAALFALLLTGAAAPHASGETASAATPDVREPGTAAEDAATRTDPEPRSAAERAEGALAAFAQRVTGLSDASALNSALAAYYRFAEARPEKVRKPYLYFVDYGLSNATPRGWVLDMERLEVVDGPFIVAHGSGSSRGRNGVPTSFSNRPGSNASSLGLYVAGETYAFRGKAGGRRYRSIGLRMHGQSGRFNDAALRRGVVAHGAPYVGARDAGRSQGCPAVSMQRAKRLMPLLANGAVVILYSPRDGDWLRNGPWIAGG